MPVSTNRSHQKIQPLIIKEKLSGEIVSHLVRFSGLNSFIQKVSDRLKLKWVKLFACTSPLFLEQRDIKLSTLASVEAMKNYDRLVMLLISGSYG